MNKKRVCYMTILTEEQPPKSVVGHKFASTQTRDSFCCVRNVRNVVGGIRILVSRRKTNQHCLSVLNRGSRDEHAKQRVRSGAVPMRAACEDRVAMCEPRHQEQGRGWQSNWTKFLEEDGGFVHWEERGVNVHKGNMSCASSVRRWVCKLNFRTWSGRHSIWYLWCPCSARG